MLEDAEKDLQMGHYTNSEIDTMFKDFVAQTVGDRTDGDCDNDDIKEFGRETSTILQLYIMSLQSTIAQLHHCLSFLSI